MQATIATTATTSDPLSCLDSVDQPSPLMIFSRKNRIEFRQSTGGGWQPRPRCRATWPCSSGSICLDRCMWRHRACRSSCCSRRSRWRRDVSRRRWRLWWSLCWNSTCPRRREATGGEHTARLRMPRPNQGTFLLLFTYTYIYLFIYIYSMNRE